MSDGRGITALGAVAIALGAGLVGGLVDVLTGEGLRTVFAVCFVLGCAFAAYRVHREDLFAAIVIPPLAYVVLALIAGIGSDDGPADSFLKQQVYELSDALILRAPVLLIATGVAAAIAAFRWSGFRRR